MSWNSGNTCSLNMVLLCTNQTRSNPWALSWTVSPFDAVSVVRDFGALDEILRRRKITGRALKIVIGHITFVLLGARPALCTLHTCYRFMRAHYHVAARLWTETRAELVAVRGLLIFSQSEWTRAWNTRVYSTDSSLSGWGMTHADWPKDVVERTGRVSGRRRFISGGPVVRESALSGGFGR